ncbi:Alcohol dehydrogenase transcription factor Myb/SANT-like [Nesidiocoris tenuis]|uniref:Alcohol dehydrogenase transcription factor Myb/SANT-like n=1 Tax=Nesidiocoris tenuis TaxID=355587 RepID=A0ABN7BBC6_9HEMI|nr:Alcohol dehydrogenase transcription factor Myb/SANT-like [Nesidiocoris tenuis]
MDWSEDEISTLLVLYKKNDVLWNPANPNYFRREVKIEAWQNLAAQLNRSEEECRRKMSSLLSSYRRERGREKRANKKGGGKFSSRWFAYDSMRFLETRGPARKLNLSKIEGYDDDELNGLDEDDEPFELYPIQTIEEGSGSEDESNTTSSRPTIQMVETNLQPAPKRARVEKSEETDEQLSRGESLLASAADLMKSTATALSRNRDTCEVKTFCDFLAAKMLTYSKKTSRSVQHAVFDVLVQADRGTFECDKSKKNESS